MAHKHERDKISLLIASGQRADHALLVNEIHVVGCLLPPWYKVLNDRLTRDRCTAKYSRPLKECSCVLALLLVALSNALVYSSCWNSSSSMVSILVPALSSWRQICSCALDALSIIIRVPPVLPWRHNMLLCTWRIFNSGVNIRVPKYATGVLCRPQGMLLFVYLWCCCSSCARVFLCTCRVGAAVWYLYSFLLGRPEGVCMLFLRTWRSIYTRSCSVALTA